MHATISQNHSYLLGHEERELARLRRQADFYAPFTEQAIRIAGIEPGMRVLDAGCGAGDVTQLLAQRVGPTGQVIAVDQASEAVAATRARVEKSNVANVDVVQEDIATIRLDTPVDAVVGRLVLMHVAEPIEVLRNLRQSLATQGIMLFQELDIGIARSEPPASLVEQMIELCRQAFQRAGVDHRPGLRLHDQFVAAGLPAPELSSLGRIEAAPAIASTMLLTSVLTTLLPAIEATGLGTAETLQLDTLPGRLQDAAESAGSLVFTPTLITAWTVID
jgi:SAM-dependent methyltransferase